jgi:Acyl-CoA reductase (LuxC)
VNRTVEDRVRDVRRWLDAARAVYADRARLTASIAASTGLSIEGVTLGFESLELDATQEQLHALVAAAGSAAHIHVILSANVFIAPLRAIAIARAAAARVTVRPSSRDPTLAGALVAAAGDPAVSLAGHRDAVPASAERIDVYGRDETIAHVRRLARPRVVVRGHGAGLGVAFVARAHAGALETLADALAADVIPFDQRGCLSPRIVFVEAAPARAEAFALALHQALDHRGSQVPRGSLTPDERGEATRWRETLAFAGRVWVGADHLVGLDASGTPAMALAVPPAGRHVLVVPVESALQARDLLAPIAPFVVSVGLRDADPHCLVAPPHARVASVGTMQRPPLDGPVDRRSL